MGKVLRIFRRDLKRVVTTPAVWIVVLFLAILPSLYTWFNVAGFWNPYENTHELRVCVVNEDQGAESEQLGHLDVGDQIVGKLKTNTQLSWVFVSRDEAMREIEAGTAYAVFIIPSDFSADIASITTGQLERPTLEYYVNEKKSPVSPKVTDAGANTLNTTINNTFVSEASGVIANLLNERLADVRGEVDGSKSSSLQSLTRASDDLKAARGALSKLKDSTSEAKSKADDAKGQLATARTEITRLSATLAQASTLIGQISNETYAMSSELGEKLDSASTALSQVASRTATALAGISAKITASKGEIDAAINRTESVLDHIEGISEDLEDLRNRLASTGIDTSRIDSVLSELDAYLSAARSRIDALQSLDSNMSDFNKAISSSASSAIDQIQAGLAAIGAYRATISGTVLPALGSNLTQLSADMEKLGSAVAGQSATIDQAIATLDQLESALSLSQDAIDRTDALLGSVEGDLDTVITDIQSLSGSSAIASLIGDDGIDPDRIAEFMSSPTQVVTEELYPVESYGSSLAPLFINLTLWIGVFMLMVIIRLEVDDEEELKGASLAQRYFGRWLLLGLIASLQAIACVSGCLIMGVQSANIPLFYVTAIIISLAYLSIQYTLSLTLQHVGRGLCIILVFLQIPGATGLYPIEMTPQFYQSVYHFLPFTYGINAMRETICGFYGTTWINSIGVLLVYLAIFAAIGALARTWTINLNRMVSRELESSDIVNIEHVDLPEQRYRASQIIRLMAQREEYRGFLLERYERFMRFHSRSKRIALVAGLGVPVVLTALLVALNAEKVVILTSWLIWLFVVIFFLVGMEFIRARLSRQTVLQDLSDTELQRLYMGHEDEAPAAEATSSAAVPAVASSAPQPPHTEITEITIAGPASDGPAAPREGADR
ncbi:MAG: YhgE/Pip domain-containing protein [Coriobacteriales bacterium]|nr:YhgE/Pip domain-containing protein [Coriobacteriales bacterium]